MVVDRAVMVGRPQQGTVLTVHSPGVTLHAVGDLAAVDEQPEFLLQIVGHQFSLWKALTAMTSSSGRRGAGVKTVPSRSRATGSRQPWT